MRKVARSYGILFSLMVMSFMIAGPVQAAVPNQLYYRVWPWYWYSRPYPVQPTVPTAPHPAQPTVPSLPGNSTPVPSTGTGANSNVSDRELTADENYILKQVNVERAKAGLSALQIDFRLVQTARAKSLDMIQGGYFDHQSPTLGSPFDQMRKAGITYRYAGENIAGNSSAAGAMVSWMNSSGHRANILNPNYTRIGIGVVSGGPYGKMLTQQFIG
jgi:uncharacterized YkwD family protein